MTYLNPGRLATLLTAAWLGFAALSAAAHGDEDHSQEPKSPAGATLPTAAAQRLPDGSLWVPKAAQRQLGIRTVLAEVKPLASAVELNGRVIADPNAGGRVQASQSGRIEAGAKGLPILGQRVSKGQLLFWLRPAIGSVERSNQRAALAELEALVAIAQRKAERYAQLEGALAQRDIESARFELTALIQRRAAIKDGIGEVQALTAPVSGVISAANVVNGQVVEAREILLEIVDPARLWVEALTYDPAMVEGLASASAAVPGGQLDLQFMGGGRQLREQALPLLFRVKHQPVPLALGQPVKVIAKTSHLTKGIAVPLAAVARNSAGESAVWVHLGPEQFIQRRVSTQALDATTVLVSAGLTGGERVVGQGSNLLAQVR